MTSPEVAVIGTVLGILAAIVVVVGFVALYLWTRRSERDIEIPTRELTDEDTRKRLVEGGIITQIISGGGSLQ